ncbi:Enoyl-CoA-hydratase [Thalassocella blandensis]|nr:Enoyl-CoA-hydratase [Thalassocella blandensis]
MQNKAASENLHYNIDAQGVAHVILSNPAKHNAFDEHVLLGLKQIFHSLADDSQVRLLVLSAEGKSFSAGADLAWMQKMVNYSAEENQQDAQVLADVMAALYRFPKPTIVRVQGAAYGGALGLIACCDIAFATESATFCLSEVKLGLIPAVISPFVIEAIGARAARRYFQTAEKFSAARAMQLGLISEVYSSESIDDNIADLIRKILANGPTAMAASKQLVAEVADKEIDEDLLEFTSKRIAEIRVSAEAQEGLTAFFEKRSAEWVMR